MRALVTALLALVTALLCSTALAAQCYFPNGDKVNSDTACNPNLLVSACCYDNQACLSNGLCVSDPHNPTKARLHRGTCTDASWKSGNCPRQCLDIDNNGVPVYSCNSTTTDSYCCYDNCDCSADSASEIFTFAQSPADVYTVTIIGELYSQTQLSSSSSSSSSPSPSSAPPSTSAATSSTTSSASSSAPTTAPPTSTSTPTPQKPNTTALGVGLGVGIPLAALLGVGLFYLLRRNKRPAYAAPSELSADEYALDPRPPTAKYAHVGGDSAAVMHELSGMGEKRVELPVPVYASGAAELEGGRR